MPDGKKVCRAPRSCEFPSLEQNARHTVFYDPPDCRAGIFYFYSYFAFALTVAFAPVGFSRVLSPPNSSMGEAIAMEE